MKYDRQYFNGIRISIWINYSFDWQQPFLLHGDENYFKLSIGLAIFLVADLLVRNTYPTSLMFP